MAVWDELKVVLTRLREQPGTFIASPGLDGDEDRQPPIAIWLAAWATAAADELHQRFGDDVELRVGALPYPPGHPPRRPPATVPRPPAPGQLDPDEITVELDGPAVVSSGRTLRHGLLLTNRTDAELQIATNGQVTTAVVDPHSGEVVGGFAGAQAAPLIIFRVGPGQTEQIPLLTGTASRAPRLGYTVPPGHWGVQATLVLGPHPVNSPRGRTPILPLTVTA